MCDTGACLELCVTSRSLFLAVEDLMALDAACRGLCAVNRVHAGPWCCFGRTRYRGMRIACAKEESYDDLVARLPAWRLAEAAHLDWKYGFRRFLKLAKMLQAPYIGNHIVGVYEDDETANFRVAVDVAASQVYVELHILENPDRLSLCLADFDWGGNTSLSFHPDSGVVLWERDETEESPGIRWLHKGVDVQEAPRERFLGTLGMLISDGLVLFALCHIGKDAWAYTRWIPLDWPRAGWVRPCMSFRSKGLYRVTVAQVSAIAPFDVPPRSALVRPDQWCRHN
jgi:hypothetical protein